MGLTGRLAGAASRAPAPVFAVGGPDVRDDLRRLRLDRRIAVVDSPRHAGVLLVAGAVPPSIEDVVPRIHDELAPPRCTVRWPAGAGDPAAAVVEAWRSVVRGRIPSEPDLLPDVDPAPWRGIGPYGQGGTGMTGGVPYGRPLTGRAPDRDRLELDQVAARIGPAFPALPAGLELEVRLQGDLLQDVVVVPPASWPVPADIFRAAAAGGVRMAELELARARHHLRALADALRVVGLPALGLRVLAMGEAPVLPVAAVDRLHRRLRRDPVLPWVGRNAVIRGEPGFGLVSRAGGVADDQRSVDPAYRALGFEPVVHDAGDVLARLLQRAAEARQAIELAARAGDAVVDPSHVEGLRGHGPGAERRLLDRLPELLAGLEWGDAVAAVASLDVEPAATTAVAA